MGRYLSATLCPSSANKTYSYCKIRYLMILLRKYPHLAKAPLCQDIYRSSLVSSPHASRCTRKSAFKSLNCNNINSTFNQFPRDYSKEVKHLQFAHFYSSSSRNTFKAEAPVGILEEAKSSFNLGLAGGRLGQSFNQLARHINIYFKRKDVVPLDENACLVVTTPEYLSRPQRRGSNRAAREQKTFERNNTMQTLRCKDKQEISASTPTQGNSTLQLFHISSLATTFGESYSYVANHINSVFSRGFTKDPVQEDMGAIPSPRMAHRRLKKRKIQNSCIINTQEAENSRVKFRPDQEVREPANMSSSWEDGFLHFARHINKYFGAKVTDKVDQHQLTTSTYKSHFPTQSVSRTQASMSQSKLEDPPESRGLFHSSHNATNFGENYFQMASHINQYFKGQSELDKDIDTNLPTQMDAGSATSESTVSFMDCLRHPTSAIPDLLGTYLKMGPKTRTSRPSTMSPQAILNKKVSSKNWRSLMLHWWRTWNKTKKFVHSSSLSQKNRSNRSLNNKLKTFLQVLMSDFWLFVLSLYWIRGRLRRWHDSWLAAWHRLRLQRLLQPAWRLLMNTWSVIRHAKL